ncbi:MAG: MBL fold metallo-hydrolase [bacterium]|nr:MBL fold metallo-hydrolase [bacterium]
MKPPTLTFCGGCGGTTGSNYLLETETTKILVDCGLHQGSSFGERHNYEPFPYDPKSIDAVFITHGHVDHIGRLPQLVKAGLTCPIYSTPPTKDVAEFLLLDSEHLLEEEARKKKHAPLYRVEDVATTLSIWRKVPYHEPITVGDITATLYDAGHILGSASILVEAGGKRIVFSGDLGNMPEPLINPVEYFTDADYVLVESTYGGRVHEELDRRRDILEDVIENTAAAGGTLMIPAFALERTQELLFELNQLIEHGRVPTVPVFIDSPLAIKLTAIYQKYARDHTYFNEHAVELIRDGENIFNFPGLRLTLTTEESKQINEVSPPKVIVAGAGMSNGGRILHHERRYLSDPKSAILFIGYQGVGSLGRMVLEGAETVKIFGETVPVRARKYSLSGYSAHADQPQLLRWVEPLRLTLTRAFVVQGDADQAEPLAQKIRDEFAVDAVVPSLGDSAVLS